VQIEVALTPKLLRQPRPFNLHTNRHLLRLIGHGDAQWRKYLFF